MERRNEGEGMTPGELRAEVWRAFDRVSDDGGESARMLEIVDELVKAEPPLYNCADAILRFRVRQLVARTMLRAYKHGEIVRETYHAGRPGTRENVIWRRAE